MMNPMHESPRFHFQWRRPWAGIVRSADRHWFGLNRYPGVVIGLVVGLPKFSSRPGYPMLSVLWGRPGPACHRVDGERPGDTPRAV
jgi:hypothetical protein